MKLNKQLSTKQKTTLKKAPQILAALLFMGILATQLNQDKEIEEISKAETTASQYTLEEDLQSLNQQEVQNSPAVAENLAADNLALEEEQAAEVLTTLTTAKTTTKTTTKSKQKTKAIVASPTSIEQNSSAVAYTRMKMELNNYTGKLRWGSSFQRNIKKFIVERSVDDDVYTEIGSIAGEGKGEYSQEKSYELEDKDLMMVQMPRIFYRIKQEGIAGDSDYSDVIEYDLGVPEGIYASIDVKTNKQVRIQYSTPQSGPLDYKILDAFGEPVSEGELQGTFDPQSLTLEIAEWEKGSYYLQFEAGKHSFMEAFTIN